MLTKSRKRFVSLLTLLLAFTIALAGCATNASNSQAASSSSSSTAAATSKELFGKPWVTSVEAGNLPAQAPAATDDLYTHYAYDWLAANQDASSYYASMYDGAYDLQESVTNIINDASKTSHDLEQLRILYNQLKDRETIQKTGWAEVEPYIERVQKATTIEELNKVLAADDFPFCSFIFPAVSQYDTRKEPIVTIYPNFVCSDGVFYGGEHYHDSDDSEQNEARHSMLEETGRYVLARLTYIGKTEEEIADELARVIAFEKSYGAYADGPSMYLDMEYGAYAKALDREVYTLDELCAACPNFPLREIIEKVGMGDAKRYYPVNLEWLKKFSEAWATENLETIRTIVVARILYELEVCIELPEAEAQMASMGIEAPDAQTKAWNGCDRLTTFDHAIAKLYVYDVLGEDAKERLTKLSQNLVGAYKDIMAKTPWTSAESKARIAEKLDHLSLNILEPQGGYASYDSVNLVPSEAGGTALSNYLLLKKFHYEQAKAQLAGPCLPNAAWEVLPATTASAIYDPLSNSISIYPGYVTSPMYTPDMTDAELMGTLSTTIANVISRGFDYIGSQTGAYGQAEPVLVGDDIKDFTTRTDKLASYYSTIEVAPGTNVIGTLVVGEAAADLCGVQATLQLGSADKSFDWEAFFSSYVGLCKEIMPEGYAVLFAMTNPYPAANVRINVSCQMFDEFYEHTGAKEGDGMYLAPEKRLAIWGENS
ncbi:MAG: M13-type metalloendopeptidase [Coriobacteriales bacterium]|nr:M13-type metalloendopeptidase [Coriobacteriales bacterium]